MSYSYDIRRLVVHYIREGGSHAEGVRIFGGKSQGYILDAPQVHQSYHGTGKEKMACSYAVHVVLHICYHIGMDRENAHS